jgi:hypothetical protein
MKRLIDKTTDEILEEIGILQADRDYAAQNNTHSDTDPWWDHIDAMIQVREEELVRRDNALNQLAYDTGDFY